jgi:hypothetical protein
LNGAVFSSNRFWRYSLTRDLVSPLVIGDEIREGDSNTCLFVCLNPSTADEYLDDPTVTRCVGFAKRWGYSRLVVCNIFAIRSTDPKALYYDPTQATPFNVVGPDNDRHILDNAKAASIVICAWGNHGAHLSRGPLVAAKLHRAGVSLHVLGTTKSGHPLHPLYLKKTLEPVPW